MTTKIFLPTTTRSSRWLPVGALLLLAQAGYAQTSFNRWEMGTSSPTTTPARRAARAASSAATPATGQPLPAAEPVRRTPAAVAAYSKPLRRGLGQRLRASAYSAPDAAFYQYAWQHLHYPASALQAGLSGQVLVRLNVNAAGDVIDSEVLSADIQQTAGTTITSAAAAGKAAMRQSAEDLLWGLRFEPAAGTTQEDVPVRYVIQ